MVVCKTMVLTASRCSLGFGVASVDSTVQSTDDKRCFIVVVERNARQTHRINAETFALNLAWQAFGQHSVTDLEKNTKWPHLLTIVPDRHSSCRKTLVRKHQIIKSEMSLSKSDKYLVVSVI